MAYKFWSGGHTRHRLLYHLVWAPKYRKRVLGGEIAKSLLHLIYEAVKVNGWWAEEVKIMPDHVHLLLQIHPSESVSEVVQSLKGGTSRLLQKQFPEIEEFVWGHDLWATGYFAETLGTKSARAVKEYIKANKESRAQNR